MYLETYIAEHIMRIRIMHVQCRIHHSALIEWKAIYFTNRSFILLLMYENRPCSLSLSKIHYHLNLNIEIVLLMLIFKKQQYKYGFI